MRRTHSGTRAASTAIPPVRALTAKGHTNSAFKKQPFNPAIPATTQGETQASRKIDATKDYAHAFRESGRYGSHPSHDRFDDDSDP